MSPSTRLLLVSTCLVAAAGAPALADGDPTGETIKVTYDEEDREFGRLHITAQGGFNFSSPNGGWTVSAGALFEPVNRIYLSGRGLVGISDRDAAPMRFEGTIHLIASDKPVVEYQDVTIDSKREGDVINRTYVKLPYVARKRFGIDATLLYAAGPAKFDNAGTEVVTTTKGLIAAAGITALNTTGFVSTVEKVGKVTNFSWTVVGIEALYDVSRSYDVEPADDQEGSKWGGRMWGESIIGREYGLSGRIELGKYPGQTGWLLLIGIGAGIHML